MKIMLDSPRRGGPAQRKREDKEGKRAAKFETGAVERISRYSSKSEAEQVSEFETTVAGKQHKT